MWEPKKIESLYFKVDETGMECRFPMPFKKSARIILDNLDNVPVSGRIIIALAEADAPTAGQAISTAAGKAVPARSRTAARCPQNRRARPLAVVCLAYLQRIRSFWVMESDETMTKDKERQPFWHEPDWKIL